MRGMATIFLAVGIVAVVGGIAGSVWGVVAGNIVSLSLIPMFASFAVVGAIFILVGRYVGKLDMSGTIRNGVPATAQVLSVQDTGVTINNLSMVAKVKLLVTVPGAPPYEAETRAVLSGRTQWGAIQPGMTLAVKVDPDDPSKVAIEGRSAAHMTPEAMAAGVNQAFAAAGPQAAQTHGVVTLKAADIIRDGVKTEGALLSVTPTGLTAAQAAGGLAPEEGDDPLVVVAFTYIGDEGREEKVQCVVRVPDGKAGFLAAGARVPVAYLPGRSETATIDWTRMA